MAAPVEENPAPASQESRTPSAHDLEILSRQLGRPVRDVVEIPARCVCGNPLVAATAPRLSNGTPFPTTFYLTHPVITAAVSRLEAGGLMNDMNERLTGDERLAAAYRSAHEAYLQALDAGRHAAGRDPCDFRDVSRAGTSGNLVTRLQIGFVGAPVSLSQPLVRGEPFVHFIHEAARLEPRHGGGDDGVRQIERRRKRSAIAQTRSRRRDQRIAAHAARRDFDDVAHGPPELAAEDFQIVC